MFDFTNVEEQKNYVDAGVYDAHVEKAEFKMSQAGSEYLSVGFQLDKEKMFVWEIFNVFHPKDQVRNIAMSQLKGLLAASGIDASKMAKVGKEELLEHVLTCRCSMKLKVVNDDYGTKNKVVSYMAQDEGVSDKAPF